MAHAFYSPRRLLPWLSALAVASSLAIAPALAQTSPAPPALPPALTPATNPAISFRRPLRINNIRTSNRFELRRAEYRFIIDFPPDAVESLAKLTFEQVSGAGYPRYRDGDHYAFDSSDRAPLPLSVEQNERERTITVEFDPPVEPGRSLTVAFKARNPRSGIYTYQLTAFPVGATEGQYAGVESLTFYDPGRRRFRR